MVILVEHTIQFPSEYYFVNINGEDTYGHVSVRPTNDADDFYEVNFAEDIPDITFAYIGIESLW